MPFALPLIVVLLAVPLVELYLLIWVGARIGAVSTILLSLLTAVLGVYLVRRQGFAVLARIGGAVEGREPLARDLLEGFLLLVAGICLLLPGFFTDLIGFLLLVPQLRRGIAAAFLERVAMRDLSRAPVSGEPRSHRVIEGEFRREDE